MADVVKIARELNSDESRYFRAVSVVAIYLLQREREGGREGEGRRERETRGKKGNPSSSLTPYSLSHFPWIELTSGRWWAEQERL